MSYCDFKPGDTVVCIDADGLHDYLVEGNTYVLSEVGVISGCTSYPHRNGLPGVRLVGVSIPLLDGNGFLRADRFRKVQRRKTDLSIETFLTIKPGFEEPKRAPKKEHVS